MAYLNDLKELLKGQDETRIKRREKEKEEEDEKRKEDKEEVKDMFKNHMKPMKENIRDIRTKQDHIEGQVLETEDKLTKKYNDMANKVGYLEKKIREMAEKEKVEGEGSTWSALHPVGRQQSACQPAAQVAPHQLPTPTSSLAPGRKDRKKRARLKHNYTRLQPMNDKNTNISTHNRFAVLHDFPAIPQIDGFMSDTEDESDGEEEGELQRRGGRRRRARAASQGVQPGTSGGRGGRSQTAQRGRGGRGSQAGRAGGIGRGRTQAWQQEQWEGGSQLPANRIEDEQERTEEGQDRVEGGRQLPARRTEDRQVGVEGGRQPPACRTQEGED